MQKSKDAKEEGVQIALESIERIRKLPGIHGFHLMAVGWEAIVPRLIKEAGLARPKLPAHYEAPASCFEPVGLAT